jgi:hypothetical protein
MSTPELNSGVNSQALADLDAIMMHLADKTPVNPELSRRVEERADRAIAELRNKRVHIDIEQLIQDARDDA